MGTTGGTFHGDLPGLLRRDWRRNLAHLGGTTCLNGKPREATEASSVGFDQSGNRAQGQQNLKLASLPHRAGDVDTAMMFFDDAARQ